MKKAMLRAIAVPLLLASSLSASAQVANDSDLQPMITGGPFAWVTYASVVNPPSRCMDGAAYAHVTHSVCNGGNSQLWTHTQDQVGDEIRNSQTGLCLESGAPTSPYVTTQDCNGGNTQRWS